MATLTDQLTSLGPSPGVSIARKPVGPDWARLSAGLALLRSAPLLENSRRQAAVQLAHEVLSAIHVAWAEAGESGELIYGPQQGDADVVDAFECKQAAKSLLAQHARREETACVSLRQGRTLILACSPETVGRRSALAAIVTTQSAAWAGMAALQLIIDEAELAELSANQAGCKQETAATAAALDLGLRLGSAEGESQAARRFVDLVAQHVGADRVAIGYVRGNAQVCLAAVSDVVSIDRKAEAAPLYEAALAELAMSPRAVVRIAREDLAAPHHRALAKLTEAWSSSLFTSLCLKDRDGEPVAVALVASNASKEGRFLELAAHTAGPLLAASRRATLAGRWRKLATQSPAWLTKGRVAALAACAIGALAAPWPDRTTCDVVLEPVTRRYAAAPFEGVFDRSLAQPGDRVQSGQVLGLMDGRDVRGKLSATEAELSRSARSRDMNLAAGKLAAAQIDGLEMDRLEHERQILARRVEQLEIRSPCAGIVVSGDLRKFEGGAVEVGRSLYEVAPLDRLTAELAVPEEDVSRVVAGAEVSLRLDAAGDRSFEGTVERLNPRAEIRDEQQVFIAEVSLQNLDDRLRPGMHGQARVDGGWTPGAWILLRKPVHAVRTWLWW